MAKYFAIVGQMGGLDPKLETRENRDTLQPTQVLRGLS